MKNIAIITGASSGMGKDFALTFEENVNVDECWVIARRIDRLEELKEKIKIPVRPISLDLGEEASFKKLNEMLKKEKVNIKLLINASGYGKFEKTSKLSYEDNIGMVNLNVVGLTKMTLTCLPYMKKGSGIINIASMAALQPVPYMNIYAATKAYVLSFTRALNRELKSDGIHVMALCPYWTKTEFFDRAVTKNDVVKKYVVMYDSRKTVLNAWKDFKKKKQVSFFGFISKGQRFLTNFLSSNALMSIWMKQQKLK